MEDLYERIDDIYLPRMTPERWEELKNFPLKADDVFIVTYPRSGTTWTQQIVKLLRSGGRKDSVLLDRAIPWLEVLDSDLGCALGYTPDMAISNDAISPRAFKSHMPYEFVPGGLPHATPAKYIYVIRNPKDVCVSYWHLTVTMHTGAVSTSSSLKWEEFVSKFLSDGIRWGCWFDHVLGWLKHKNAPNILFMKYEDMKHDPHTSVRTIAKFIGIEGITEELVQEVVRNSSFSSMKSDDTCNGSWLTAPGQVFSGGNARFLRRGEIGTWREHLSVDQNRQFDDMCARRLSDSGLKFDTI